MLSLVPQNDLQMLSAALVAAHLPADDLGEPGRRFYRAVDGAGATLGYGGIEGEGQDRLLRSVVIVGDQRRKGLGAALVAGLAAEAKAMGAARLWLLTTDADSFFRRLGFADVARETAPPAITTSRQFAGLCPASAKLLARAL